MSEALLKEKEEFLSVVVPVYNEEETLAKILEKLLKIPHLLEIIVVDDCSTDRSGEIAKEFEARYDFIRYAGQPENQGKTAALRTGFQLTKGEIVIVQDADLEYDPEEIEQVIFPIVEGFADVVYGSRFLIKRASRVLYYYHYLANKGLTLISNLLTNLNFTDMETCYKAFRGEIIRNITITSSGFGFEVEVTAKIAKLGCVVYEVPISYYGRTYEEGKKIKYSDGLAALWYIIKFNMFCSLRQSYNSIPELGKQKKTVSLKEHFE